MTKYIQGDDGKFAGSIGDGKNKIPTQADAPGIPNPYAQVSESLERVNEIDKEINATLADGLAEVSSAFDGIIKYYEERAAASAERIRLADEALAASKVRMAEIDAKLQADLAEINRVYEEKRARRRRWISWIPGVKK